MTRKRRGSDTLRTMMDPLFSHLGFFTKKISTQSRLHLQEDINRRHLDRLTQRRNVKTMMNGRQGDVQETQEGR